MWALLLETEGLRGGAGSCEDRSCDIGLRALPADGTASCPVQNPGGGEEWRWVKEAHLSSRGQLACNYIS